MPKLLEPIVRARSAREYRRPVPERSRSASVPLVVFPLSSRQLAIKRLLDISVVLVVLIPALLVGGIAALLVRVSSRGPVLFRQVRTGRGGRHFVLYKLRSMTDDAERRDGPTWAVLYDPRLTLVGKHLKALHVDELPQLWNVLRGDMSVVGPRPERPVFVGQFAERIAGYERRHVMPVGMTGLAQLEGNYATAADEKLVYDLAYAVAWSLVTDLKLLARTPFVVFCRYIERGARAQPPPDLDIKPAVADPAAYVA